MAFLPSLKRSVRLALDNLTRNKILSLTTMGLIALILLIFNVLFSVNLLAQQGIRSLEGKVDLIVYLKKDVDPLAVSQLIQELKALPEIKTIQHTTEEEALESLLETYSSEVNPFTAYDLENPLPASLQIVTQSPEDHPTILDMLEQPTYQNLLLDIESRNENEHIVKNLTQITRFSQKILVGIVATFLIGSLLIIANAIQLTLFQRKREIEIMRLVGAPLGVIRAPFMVEGALYGLTSTLVAFTLFLVLKHMIDLSELTFLQGEIAYTPLLLIQSAASVLLGMGSSLLAVQNHLKHHA